MPELHADNPELPADGASAIDTQTTVLPQARPDAMLDAVVQAALAVPGIVRLEPTLSTAGPGVLVHRRPSDGVRVLVRAGVPDIDISIATSSYQARAVTHQLQGVMRIWSGTTATQKAPPPSAC